MYLWQLNDFQNPFNSVAVMNSVIIHALIDNKYYMGSSFLDGCNYIMYRYRQTRTVMKRTGIFEKKKKIA